MYRTLARPGNKARWLALFVSTVLSSTLGWELYRIVRASPASPLINSDYTLTFVDAHGRPLTEKLASYNCRSIHFCCTGIARGKGPARSLSTSMVFGKG